MPRFGLPAKSKTGGDAVPRRSMSMASTSSTSFSGRALVSVAAGALMFRIVSALVETFVAGAFAKPVAAAIDSGHSTFGIYPLLTRELSRLLAGLLPRTVTADLVVSWLAFALAIGMVAQIAKLDMAEERADGAALLAAVFPFASVFGHANADALFLVFALTAFYGVRQGQWIVGGIGGALATATLPAGVLMLPALALTGWRSAGPNRMRLLIALAISACGFAGYLVYLYYLGGPPGGWTAATADWGFRIRAAPWAPIRDLLTAHLQARDALNAVVACVFLAAAPIVWWRFDAGYGLYVLAMFWLPLISGRFDSLGRACALMFPVFALIAGVRWRVVVMATVVTSAMFYALALAL
jgi:hypothetical protein